jgi:hypothetical protein
MATTASVISSGAAGCRPARSSLVNTRRRRTRPSTARRSASPASSSSRVASLSSSTAARIAASRSAAALSADSGSAPVRHVAAVAGSDRDGGAETKGPARGGAPVR